MHCAVRWIFCQQKLRNGVSSMVVSDDGEEKLFGVRCGCFCHISNVVGGDWIDNAFLRDDLIVDDDYKLMLLTSPLTRLVFKHRFLSLSLWPVASVLRKPCCNFVNKVTWHVRWCTVAFFPEPQYEFMLCRMDSNKCSIKTPLSTYTLYTLSHRSALFHNAVEYLVGGLFNGWVRSLISVFVSTITSSVEYFPAVSWQLHITMLLFRPFEAYATLH